MEAAMAGEENLQIVREIFAAWNADDIEAFVSDSTRRPPSPVLAGVA